MDRRIAIIGYSGHAYVVLDTAFEQGVHISSYCESKTANSNPFQLEYLGFENDPNFDWNAVEAFVLGIGDNSTRVKIANKIQTKGKPLVNVIHPSTIISQKATLGEGIYIGPNVSLNALAIVQDFCILNTGCIIEHECKIETGAHIAPGAVLAGAVSVGSMTFVGANSVIKQGVKIGKNVIVGAGSVVLTNIPDNEIWAGNPAKKINKK